MALAETARLIASLELRDKFSGPARNAERALGRLDGRTSALGRNLNTIGTVAGGLAIGGLVAATKAAIDFEEAFAGIRKTVDEADLIAVGLSFESLSGSIRGMAREIPVAATELSRIGEAAGALGIAAGDIEEFTRVVAELSVTTDLTSEQASTALGHLGTILDLTGSEFRDFGDSLVALGNAGASTESEIIDLATRFAAAGKSAGLSNEEILALSSAVASMGIEAEAGGSALSRVFNNVAVGIGTSSVKAEAFADTLGLSAAEFRRAWERDAVGTFEDFLVQLNELDQFEAADLLKKVGITNVRDVNTVRLMAQNIDDVNAALEVSRSATGALGTEAAERFATTASQIQILKNNLTDVGITIGSVILPKITEFGKRLADALNTPGGQRAIQEFAAGIPGVIDDLVEIAKNVPWQAIGSALQLAGTGARAVLGAFKAMPPWVQTAVLTGWGLNKLTGGALTGLIGSLASGLIKGVLGMNAGVVNINAGVVNGGGGVPVGPGPAAGGARAIIGNITKFLGLASGVGLATLLGAEVGKSVAGFLGVPSAEEVTAPAIEFETDELERVIETNSPATLQAGIDSIDDGIRDLVLAGQTTTPFGIGFGLLFRDQLQVLIDQRAALQRQLDALKVIDESIGAAARSDHADVAAEVARLAAIEGSIGTAAQADRTDAATAAARLAAIDSSIGSAAQSDRIDAANTVATLATIDASIGSAAQSDRVDAATATARLSAIDSSIGAAAQSDRADGAAQRAAIAAAKERIAAVVAAVGAAQTAKAETVAAAVRTNTAVLGAKNFAPDIAVTTNVTSNVSISDVQRRITSQQIAQSISVGGGGFAV